MRPICLVRFGQKVRPALVLSRGGQTLGRANKITVAGITSTIHGLATELRVGTDNGLHHECVVNLEDIQTVRQVDLVRQEVGWLFDYQEEALHRAIVIAFDLDPES